MGELEVAADVLRGRVIAVTGTNGKTTTTSLIGHILQACGWKSRTGGNIGRPVLSMVDDSADDTWNVLELSSFQLEATESFRSHIAVVLNVTPDHLDRHGTLEMYAAAKGRILKTQTSEDQAVLNADDPLCREMAHQARGRVWWFSRTRAVSPGAWLESDRLVLDGTPVSGVDLPIRGAHNLENALAAVVATSLAGVPPQAIGPALQTFQAVEHRLEFVRNLRGVDYYNDSKATNVDAAIKAIEAFENGLWVILGGSEKGGDFHALIEPLRQRARAVLLIGQTAKKIEGQLDGAVPAIHAETLDRAVEHAWRHAGEGDTVLLAPACASFDQFENYGHRGRVFKELVRKLT
jgi:UDP-N-acetylmuramoylalanine--D-glutamate ligase